MAKLKKRTKRKLTKRHQAVIDDLFAGSMDESEVISKHKLRSTIFRNWLQNENFTAEIRFRMSSAQRQSELIIAKYSPVAAAKLVKLTESDKEETARKACLSIISLHMGENEAKEENIIDEIEPLEAETASRLLRALAAEKK